MAQPKVPEICAQCKGPLDRKGEPKWCKECWARYQREYRVLHGEMAEAKGFARGVEAMRQAAGQHFEQFRFAHFAGQEIAKMIGTIPAPRFQEQGTPPEPQPAASGE